MSEAGSEAASPVFQQLFEHAAAKPGAVEDHPWGDTVFKVGGKIFVFLGNTRITVKAAPDDLDGLLALPFIQRAPYVGRYGWVTVTLEGAEALELALELIDASYALIAPKPKAPRKQRSAG